MLPDDVFKILAPMLPFTIPTRTPGPSPLKPSAAAAVTQSGDHAIRRSTSRRRLNRNYKSMGAQSMPGNAASEESGDEGEDSGGGSGAPAVTHEFSHLSETIQRRAAGLLRMHVLGSVRSRIEVGWGGGVARSRFPAQVVCRSGGRGVALGGEGTGLSEMHCGAIPTLRPPGTGCGCVHVRERMGLTASAWD